MWRQLRTVGLFRRPRLVFFTVIGRMPDPDEACELIRAIEHGKAHRCDGVFALGVVKALEAVQKSLKMNGAPVHLS